jgi:hypothetical protein
VGNSRRFFPSMCHIPSLAVGTGGGGGHNIVIRYMYVCILHGVHTHEGSLNDI